MTVVIDQDRIEYLAEQLAGMYSRRESSPSEFGSIALEILFMRNTAEETIETTGDANEKRDAQKALKRLRELEKTLVQLFVISELGRRRHAKHSFTEFIMRGYKIPDGY